MDIPSDYLPILGEGRRVPSHLIALLPPPMDCPGSREIEAALASSGLAPADFRVAQGEPFDGCEWVLEAACEREGENEPLEFQVWARSCERLPETLYESARLTGAEQEEITACRWTVGVSLEFGQAPLSDLHRQMGILSAAAPEALLVLDDGGGGPYAGELIRQMASSLAPPSPMSLYSIHAVSPEKGDGPVWLHTHGLLRCGIVELEMLDVPGEHSGALGELMNVVAPMLIETGLPEPGEPFVAGDGISLVWLPWQEAIHLCPPRSAGGIDDRDQWHAKPSGVLMAPRSGLLRRRYGPPSKYLRRLLGDPILYVSNMETERMSLLARERLGEFLELLDEYGADTGSFAFLVKLGYQIDSAESATEREHLWFRVLKHEEGKVFATLTNRPYRIARMAEGRDDWHSLDLMSDWAILCAYGHFSPDTVVHLRRQIAEQGPPGEAAGADHP
jgi:uncharacterized protein YegJ (DUF2314 family)